MHILQGLSSGGGPAALDLMVGLVAQRQLQTYGASKNVTGCDTKQKTKINE